MLKKIIFLCLPLFLNAGTIDVLNSLQSPSGKTMNGAQGTCIKSGKFFNFNKTNANGYIIFAGKPASDIPIKAGKSYEATADFDISGNATGSLMLSMPGSKRRPFPVKTLKNSGKAVIKFTAAAKENKVRFHAVIRGQGKVVLKSMTLWEIIDNKQNYLSILNGKSKYHDGAKGKTTTENGKVVIHKTNLAGYILYSGNSNKDIKITPKKTYEVTSQMNIENGVQASLMIAVLGGNRRPFPQQKLTKSGIAKIRFTAGEKETKLRLHLVTRGKGKAVFNNLYVKEVATATSSKMKYSGSELCKLWNVENSISLKNCSTKITGICNETTRIVSPDLNWDASKIPAVEVDMSYTPDGGSAILQFWGIENGKTFTGTLLRTNIPSGETRTVTFNFANQQAWRGTITKIAIGFRIHSQSDFSVSGVRALSEPNLIPNAEKSGKKDLELIRPGALYSLSYKGKQKSDITLKLLDADGSVLKTHTLTKGIPKLEFTTPLTTVSGEIIYKNSDGYPLLICKDLPFFGQLPEVYWTTPWIWCSVRDYPQCEVLFTKEFDLPCDVARAEARYTGDDSCSLNINGNKFVKEIRNLHCTEKRDVTSMLKAGKNRIQIAVDNTSGAGGLLFEMYVELVNGKSLYIKGDKTWDYTFEGNKGKAIERGIPPKGVWGDKVDCVYIGPRTKAEIRNFTEKGFEIMPQKQCADFGEITIKVVSNTGDKRQIPVKISPRSKAWKVGQYNKVKMSFNSELTAGMKGEKFSLEIVPEYLELPQNFSCHMTPRKIQECDFPTVKLVGAGSRPFFEVNGRKLAPFYFDLPFSFIDMPMQKAHFVANAAKAKSNIVRSWYWLRNFWKGPNQYDFSSLDFAIAVIRSQMQDAHIIITCNTFMPDWWLEQNPDHRIQWFKENRQYRNYYQTLASLKWKKDAQVAIKALMDHLRKTGNAKHIIGIVFADGDTHEWLWASHPYGGRHRFIFQSKSLADKESFAAFLTKKYGKLPYNPEIPEPELWNNRSEGVFLDPVKSRRVIDYWEFRSQCCSDGIRTFTGLVKQYSNRKLLSGAYYGYQIQLSRVFYLFQGSGHHKLNEVATSGDCDLYFAPTMYGLRVPGEPDSTMQPAEAITGNNGIPIMEFDYRTYTEFAPGQLHNGAADTPAMTLSLLDKGFGVALARAAGGHWMELHERWFREPLQYNHVAKLFKLYRSLPQKTAGTVPKDLCIVNSETSTFRTVNNSGDGIYRGLLYELCRIMPRTGTAYRHVLLKDLLTKGKVPAHKFYIFTDFFELTDEQRQAIKTRLEKEGAHALWMYGPGILKPGEKVNHLGISQMTGIEVERIDAPWTVNWESTAEFGGKTRLAYLTTGLNFRPLRNYDILVAKSGKYPSVVGKNNGNRIDYFSAALVPQEHALQEMFRRANVRIYQRGTDCFSAGNDFLVLHASTKGKKQLFIPNGHFVEQVLGPKVKFNPENPSWEAKAGLTYGFILKRKK